MGIKGFLKEERFAVLGTIRLGRRVVNKNNREYPEDSNAFIVPQEIAEAVRPVVVDGEVIQLPYGNEPTALEVMLPSSEFHEWCPIELQQWAADERLICHGDGEEAERWSDEHACWMKIDCPYKECEFYGPGKGKGCDERGTIHVILPFVNMMGVYRINTGSRHGLSNLRDSFNSALSAAVNLSGTPEMVRAITFTLTRELKTVHYLQGGVRKPSSKHLLNLRAPNLTLMEARRLSEAFGINKGGPMLSSGETLAMSGHMQGALPAAEEEEEPPTTGVPVAMPPPNLAMPEPAEPECPADLVAGASKAGPSVGARNTWAKMLEQVAELKGHDALAAIETEVCRAITPEAARFDDLAGEEEAPAALKMLSEMIRHWQKQPAEEKPAEAKKVATAAKSKPVAHIDPTDPQAAAKLRSTTDSNESLF